MAGRPTDYSVDICDAVCERLASGESMRSVSRDEAMPAMSTLFKWLREHQEFSEQYARAKEESADALADDIVDIADNQVGAPMLDGEGNIALVDGKPVLVACAVSVAHAKLRVDSRKWAASKLKPKKYGDRITTEITGSLKVSELSDEELAAIAAGGR